MRRGSVTALTQAGVSDHLVQKHMRVVSNSTVRRYATLSQEKLGKISRVVFRASAQQHWKILSPQNTVRISSAPHSSVGNHIRMFAAALIPTLEHGFSVAWFQIETKFYFGNHWMENCDFHVTIVQWKTLFSLFMLLKLLFCLNSSLYAYIYALLSKKCDVME